MDLRLATYDDLPQLKVMYARIVDDLNQKGIQIWDEVYPSEFLHLDIENRWLYILEENGDLLCAFALCTSDVGARCVEWVDNHASALYLNRLGVNVEHLKKGIGSIALDMARSITKDAGMQYMRLFVADTNQPAIDLYIKKGLRKAEGFYHKIISEDSADIWLHEYGFEWKA